MRDKIKLEYSDEHGNKHFYTTTKNRKTTTKKLELKKFNPKLRAHVLYKETKLK